MISIYLRAAVSAALETIVILFIAAMLIVVGPAIVLMMWLEDGKATFPDPGPLSGWYTQTTKILKERKHVSNQ